MGSGMAHISGGMMAVYISYGADPVAILCTCVMACPCSLYLTKLIYPEAGKPETLGEVGKLRALDMRGEHDELLPAPAKDEVARAQRAAEPAVDVHEQPVAGRVAVGVVDRLEAVEVEETERSRSAAASDPRLLGGQRLGERVAVRRARERVDARAGAFSGEGPLEAAAEPVRPRGDEQQAGREREREPRRRLEDVEEGDEQRRRQEPADDKRAPGGA